MPKPEERRRYCEVPECKEAPLAGLSRCQVHRFRRQTLREAIAAGPKWEPVEAGSSVKLVACATGCSLVPRVDRATGLCLVCWRVWRFATSGFAAPAALPDA